MMNMDQAFYVKEDPEEQTAYQYCLVDDEENEDGTNQQEQSQIVEDDIFVKSEFCGLTASAKELPDRRDNVQQTYQAATSCSTVPQSTVSKIVHLPDLSQETSEEIPAIALSLNKRFSLVPYKCSFCNVKFPSKSQMVKHDELCHKMGYPDLTSETCSNCNVFFVNPLLRKSHYCPGKFKIACSVCNLFMYPEFLVSHSYESTCSTCYETFCCETQLLTHQIRVTLCGTCNRRFCRETSFLQHCLEVHKVSGEDAFRCEQFSEAGFECKECNYFFADATKLEKHNQLKHVEFVACEFCARLFLDSKSLREHYVKSHQIVNGQIIPQEPSPMSFEIHSDKRRIWYTRTSAPPGSDANSLSFICRECDTVFMTKSLADKHVLEVHMSNCSLWCPLCDCWSESREKLLCHLNQDHVVNPQKVPLLINKWHRLYLDGDSIKNYLFRPPLMLQCGICDFSSTHEQEMKRHVFAKKISQNKYCSLCQQTFSNYSMLKHHIHLKHFVELLGLFHLKKKKGRHDCEECALDFDTSADWMEHWELLHPGAQNPPTNSYECAICKKECSTEMAAMNHVTYKHLREKESLNKPPVKGRKRSELKR